MPRSSVVEQLAACALLDDLDGSLPAWRGQLREHRSVLTAELRRRVPEPAGGPVLWCGLPQPVVRPGLSRCPGPRVPVAGRPTASCR
ncbi:hypothetical protein [Geodermatophilus obscurus]|uniref:hypothetical protein n=1 Tax=Geodermatophilus obscurus TaxID=1861 RepID=UPI0009346D2B|nr:hypothetical protein [Geodermatophilus obscurus]